MKKGITWGAIIVALGMALVFWLGGFQSGKGEVTPEQLPVSLEPMTYGAQAEAEAVWPVWSVQVVWYRSGGIYGDHLGPFTVQMQYPTKPGKADVARYVPQPAGLPGKWSVQAIYNVVQVGQAPIGQKPTPEK